MRTYIGVSLANTLPSTHTHTQRLPKVRFNNGIEKVIQPEVFEMVVNDVGTCYRAQVRLALPLSVCVCCVCCVCVGEWVCAGGCSVWSVGVGVGVGVFGPCACTCSLAPMCSVYRVCVGVRFLQWCACACGLPRST